VPQYNLFSISLISAGLALFYATSLRGLETRLSSLPGFIGSFIRAPRFVPPVKMRRGQGFGYIADLDVDTIDMRGGVSPFVVLEDGKPLMGFPVSPARPADQPSVQNVFNHGNGRYIHIGRQIVFSPSDNASQGERKYLLLETLTKDAEKLQRLLALNAQREAVGNIGAWLLAKLQIYAGDMLRTGQIDASLPTALTLQDVQIDLERYGLFQLQGRSATIRWTAAPDAAWNHVDIELRGLAAAGLSEDAWLVARIAYSADCRIRLEQLALGYGGKTWLRGHLDWAEDGLQGGEIACADLAPLRQGLSDACGGTDMQRRWIASFIDAIRSGDLPLGATLDADATETLTAAFSPEGDARALTLRLTRAGDRMSVSVSDSGKARA
jgi:hypothetical protein